MLIEFTFSNFRSFKDPATLSMVAANITSDPKSVDENNLIHVSPKLDLLTSAAIYGANASGKSNLVRAMAFMRNLVMNSSRQTRVDEPIDIDIFRLSNLSDGQPASFEAIFLLNGQKYRYGFEVTHESIVAEWLYTTPTIREAMLFKRMEQEIQINLRTFREGRGLEIRTRPKALFLSVVAQFNGPIANLVQIWFRKLGIISGLSDSSYRRYTVTKFMDDVQRREEIKRFVCALDVGIEDIQGKELDNTEISYPPSISDEVRAIISADPRYKVDIQTLHKKYDYGGKPIGLEQFGLTKNESEGTIKLFYLAGPILDTLTDGKVLFIDEMEARMHPLITVAIIRLFNSLEANPKRAQLIFTTHDTNLLDRNLFRRDQVWFTEKDRFSVSHLYSLVEFKLRNDASFERDYLHGRYGAVPYPGNLVSSFIQAFTAGEEKAEYEA